MSDIAADDDCLREDLKKRLSCLDTEIEPRAYSHEATVQVVARLQNLKVDDHEGKLRIAGFALTPYGAADDEQACETCMYYQVHRRFCELPELMLPVAAEWSCRLWRI